MGRACVSTILWGHRWQSIPACGRPVPQRRCQRFQGMLSCLPSSSMARGSTKLTAVAIGAACSVYLTYAAAPPTPDPCAQVAGKDFVLPAAALSCLKSFSFNETLRQNVLAVVGRVFDFFTFEQFYLNSPPPFQESTNNVRWTLARINTTRYAVAFRPSSQLRTTLNSPLDRLRL